MSYRRLILRALALPQAICEPIEAMHADGEPRQPLGRVLRLADAYANGMLLAAGGISPVAPLGRADCRKAVGADAPECPDGNAFRAEIMTLTTYLARLSDADARRLMGPLHPHRKVKLWLAREAGLSKFDPLAAALVVLAESVKVSDQLPGPGDAQGCGGIIVAARSPSAIGFEGAAIARAAAAGAGRTGATPVLWLAGPSAVATNEEQVAGVIRPRTWPISLDELAAFVAGCAK